MAPRSVPLPLSILSHTVCLLPPPGSSNALPFAQGLFLHLLPRTPLPFQLHPPVHQDASLITLLLPPTSFTSTVLCAAFIPLLCLWPVLPLALSPKSRQFRPSTSQLLLTGYPLSTASQSSVSPLGKSLQSHSQVQD